MTDIGYSSLIEKSLSPCYSHVFSSPVDAGDAGKPRGYAFIEFEHKNDMKTAYKMGDGKKIEGRRVLVDVERGRTVPNWYAHS